MLLFSSGTGSGYAVAKDLPVNVTKERGRMKDEETEPDALHHYQATARLQIRLQAEVFHYISVTPANWDRNSINLNYFGRIGFNLAY